MITKNFRVMIVDADHSQRLFIEKTLNGLGYYSVLGMATMKEATAILPFSNARFDLLMVNSLAIFEFGLDAAEFCKNSRFVKNAVFYGNFVPLFSEPSTYSDIFSSKVISPYAIKMNTLNALMQELDDAVTKKKFNVKVVA
ncbi:hypothetical protein [Pseudomonas yamanorum]|uniref:hypothetical protein n=1 Tax=Pseudomonas yamanorum TaxID=515393 RepID=UPI00087CB5E4|nr:hypothetical protein [Pseudomonas yamanorum]SDU51385.1 hypothetical protein SAMN05216237_6675 [Pseudomonas yamanorum]